MIYDGVARDDKSGQYWNDEEGKALGRTLGLQAGGSGCLGYRLAALVGYHARLFPSLKAGEFLAWASVSGSVVKKTKQHYAKSPAYFKEEMPFEIVFNELKGAFGNVAAYDRLRRQCALFRFVDALDISATRNPPEFLIGLKKLRFEQYRENLKRELCDSLEIRHGMINTEMKAVEPSIDLVTIVITYVAEYLLSKDDRHLGLAAKEFVATISQATIEKPWKITPTTTANGVATIDLKTSVKCLQKVIDCWLAKAWKVLTGKGAHRDRNYVSHLEAIGVLHDGGNGPTLTFAGAKNIASLTALSVAGEVLDEYQAILDVEIGHVIRLGEFTWAKEPQWKDGLPRGLDSLRKALEKT
jgi:hypothetical protein